MTDQEQLLLEVSNAMTKAHTKRTKRLQLVNYYLFLFYIFVLTTWFAYV